MSDRQQFLLLLGMVAFLLVWFLLWQGGVQLFVAAQTARVLDGHPPYEARAVYFLIDALSPRAMAAVALLFAAIAYRITRGRR